MDLVDYAGLMSESSMSLSVRRAVDVVLFGLAFATIAFVTFQFRA